MFETLGCIKTAILLAFNTRVILPANFEEGWMEQRGTVIGISWTTCVVELDKQFWDENDMDDGIREVSLWDVRILWNENKPKSAETILLEDRIRNCKELEEILFRLYMKRIENPSANDKLDCMQKAQSAAKSLTV